MTLVFLDWFQGDGSCDYDISETGVPALIRGVYGHLGKLLANSGFFAANFASVKALFPIKVAYLLSSCLSSKFAESNIELPLIPAGINFWVELLSYLTVTIPL